MFTTLYSDDEWRRRCCNTYHNTFTLQSAYGLNRNILNVLRIKTGRNKQVSISDSHHLQMLFLYLSLCLWCMPITPSSSFFNLLFLCHTDIKHSVQPIPLSPWYTSLSDFTCQLYWSAQLLQDLHTVLTKLLVTTWHEFVNVFEKEKERQRKADWQRRQAWLA